MLTMNDFVCRTAGRNLGTIAVAAAHDYDVLTAVCDARRKGIAKSILIGDAARISKILRLIGEEPRDYEIQSAENDSDCAKKAIGLVKSGEAGVLMKGLMSTADLLRVVVDKETGIRSNQFMSHIMFYQPEGAKLLAITDGGMNTFPNLDRKAHILENAARTLLRLGYDSISAACICGAEIIDPQISSMTDARALAQMSTRWAPYHMNVYGPVGLDLAVSPEACSHKDYHTPGAGKADILLVPTYEVGNALGKALSLFGKADNAGIVVGARVPIVLVSRADSAKSKMNSIALSILISSL